MGNGVSVEHVVITKPVPTPEEMAARLGISEERVATLRRIMRSTSRSRVSQALAEAKVKTKTSRKGLHAKAEAR